MAAHEPAIIYDLADPERIAPPSEVCSTCSDIPGGRLVPAPFCPKSKTQLAPASWEEN
ncbi:hypothetical protein QFZ75_008043 [Streptomyces sp. V3I8]|uniref:hypothetical protein n=1 Tax=Streptomyces sp. V3I8 TaxID=3042279 RepID=UPI002788F77D|nr:hypothetical protein [Streptomyces sp. V3I8]MDQ1041541.1 hypothetical protein [Streptomyces sp. V3I8]